MSNAEASASEYLQDLSQRTSYLLDWRQNQRKTPRSTSLELRSHCDHVELNKQVLKRQASKRYGLKEWEGRQNLIHKIEYPINQGDPTAIEQAFLQSKLCFHQETILPHAFAKLGNSKAKLSPTHRSNQNFVAATIAKAQREIMQKREAELQKIVTGRTNLSPKNKLLPSIPIKRSRPERINAESLCPGKQSRRLSLPNCQHNNIIKLIQF